MNRFSLAMTLSLAVLAAPAPIVGQDSWQPVSVPAFGGIDALRDSGASDGTTPAAMDAQDAENVLTDSGYLEKRPGNVRIAQILDGYAVKLVKEWVAPSQTRYLITHSSLTVYQTDLGGSPVALSTTATGQNLDAAAGFGRLIFQDGSGGAWYWDGTSTASIAGMPICEKVEFGDERFWCANIPSESASRVRVSSFGSYNYFTVPSNVSQVGDAPNVFDFDKDDGEGITCFKVTPFGKFWGKRHKTGFLKGYDNLTFYKKLLDPNIGCVDDRSVQMVDGLLVWLAVDGIYGYNGTGQPQLLSRDIEPLVRRVRQINSQVAQWVVDIRADWQRGAANDGGRTWDAVTSPGYLIMSSQTFVDTSSNNFAAGTLTLVSTNSIGSVQLHLSTRIVNQGDFEGSTTTWTCGGGMVCNTGAFSSGVGGAAGTVTKITDTGACNNTASLYLVNAAGETHLGNFGASFTGQTDTDGSFYYSTLAAPTTGPFYVEVRPGAGPGASGSYLSSTWTAAGFNLVIAAAINCPTGSSTQVFIDNVRVSSYEPTGTFTSRTFDTLVTTPTIGPFAVTFSSTASGTLSFREQDSADGASWGTAVSLSSGATPALKRRYWRYLGDLATVVGTMTATLYHVGPMVAVGTGTYDSEVHFIGTSITEWKQFNVTEENTTGIGYKVRAATYSFVSTATVPSWVYQPNNLTVAASTGAYYQFRIDSTSVTVSTQDYRAARVATNWQEGSGIPVASGYLDHRYFLCATLSTTSAVNDGCLVLQKNQKWTKWTGPAIGAMGTYDNDLVVGDGNTDSYVWKVMQDDVYQDDGAAISAYWVTKDFFWGDPFAEKALHEMWVDAAYTSGATLSVGYAANKATAYTSKSIDLDDTAGYTSRLVTLDSGFALGKYFRLKFSNSTIDHYFRVNRYAAFADVQKRTLD